MKYCNKLLIVIFCTILIPTTKLYSQESFLWSKDWAISGELGLDYYFGDASDNHNRIYNNSPLSSFYWDNKEFMSSITLSKQVNRLWSVRGHLSYGNLSGSNDNIKVAFTGKVYTSEMDLTFNFIDAIFSLPEKSRFKYYAFMGLGLTKLRAESYSMVTGKPLFYEGYNSSKSGLFKYTTEGMVAMGLGVKYNMDRKFFFTFETSLKYVNTDKLDAYKSTYTKLEGMGFMSIGLGYKFDLNFSSGSNSDNWDKAKGKKMDPRNSGMNNKKKTRLRNRWK